jgi:4-hydroxy-tetrahydrodipicolinate reductase
MGKAIEEIAVRNGHRISLMIDSKTGSWKDSGAFLTSDLAIEFSLPHTAADHLIACAEAKIPVVCGTTGWFDRYDEVSQAVKNNASALLWDTNFSLGVQLFFAMNRQLAAWMDRFPQDRPEIEEIHHIHKKDAPSGTAITLAEAMLDGLHQYDGWSMEKDASKIPIRAIREGEVIGTHRAIFTSAIDQLTFEHKAFNRTGFAAGAVLAAEWLKGRSGIYRMADVLDLV